MRRMISLITVALILSLTVPVFAMDRVYSMSTPWYNLDIELKLEKQAKLVINITYPIYVESEIPIPLDEARIEYRISSLSFHLPPGYLEINFSETFITKNYVFGEDPRVEVTADYTASSGGYVETKITYRDEVLRYVRIDAGKVSFDPDMCMPAGTENGYPVTQCGAYYVEGKAVFYGTDFEDLELGFVERNFTSLVQLELSMLFPLQFESQWIPELEYLRYFNVTQVEKYGEKYIVYFIALTNPELKASPAYTVMKLKHRSYTEIVNNTSAPTPYVSVSTWDVQASYYVPSEALKWLHEAYEDWANLVIEIKKKYEGWSLDFEQEYVDRVYDAETKIASYLSMLSLPPREGPEDPFLWLALLEMMRNNNTYGFNVTIDYSLENIKPIPFNQTTLGEWLEEVARKAPRKTATIELNIERYKDINERFDGLLVVLTGFLATLEGLPYDEAVSDIDSFAERYFAPARDYWLNSEREIKWIWGNPVDHDALYEVKLTIPLFNKNIGIICVELAKPFEGENYSLAVFKPQEELCILGENTPPDAPSYRSPLEIATHLYEMINPSIIGEWYSTETPTPSETPTETWTPPPTQTHTTPQQTPPTETTTETPSAPQTPSGQTTSQPPTSTPATQTQPSTIDVVFYGAWIGILILAVILIAVIAKWKKK